MWLVGFVGQTSECVVGVLGRFSVWVRCCVLLVWGVLEWCGCGFAMSFGPMA